MKKIVGILAGAAVLASSVFAVDFSAAVKVKGDVAYGSSYKNEAGNKESKFALLGVEDTAQKDDDLLTVSFTGDQAGAYFRFYTNAKESAVTMRYLKVWFEPVANVKVTLGNVGIGLYTERVNWWKVPCGASVAEFTSWDGRWKSNAGMEGYGATAEITAIENLYLGLGATSDVVSKTGDADAVINEWGAVAKYQIMDNLSAGVAYNAAANFGLLTAGVEFGNWGTPYYGFVQAKVRFDNSSAAYDGNKDPKLAGITIDNYVSYKLENGITLSGTFPVTIRGLLNKDDKSDVSYMTARAKVVIPVDSVSVYAVVGSDEGFNNGPAGSKGATIWKFDNFADNFNFYGNVGVSFNIGSAAMDIGAEVAYDKPTDTLAWAVPFTSTVKF